LQSRLRIALNERVLGVLLAGQLDCFPFQLIFGLPDFLRAFRKVVIELIFFGHRATALQAHHYNSQNQ